MPGPAEDAGVGAVPPGGVEVARAGDVGHDPRRGITGPGQGGKPGSAARRRMMRTVRMNLTRSGSISASVAALADQRRDGVVGEQVAEISWRTMSGLLDRSTEPGPRRQVLS